MLIISNSEKEWVERSCKRYLPQTFETIQDVQLENKEKIQILSAKHFFQKDFPGQPAVWKKLAFRWFADKFKLGTTTCTKNLIVVGDKDFEIKAGECLATSFENCLLKTIKYPSRKESVITPLNLATRTKFLLLHFTNLAKSQKSCKWRINSNNKVMSSEECHRNSSSKLKEETDSQRNFCYESAPSTKRE